MQILGTLRTCLPKKSCNHLRSCNGGRKAVPQESIRQNGAQWVRLAYEMAPVRPSAIAPMGSGRARSVSCLAFATRSGQVRNARRMPISSFRPGGSGDFSALGAVMTTGKAFASASMAQPWRWRFCWIRGRLRVVPPALSVRDGPVLAHGPFVWFCDRTVVLVRYYLGRASLSVVVSWQAVHWR